MKEAEEAQEISAALLEKPEENASGYDDSAVASSYSSPNKPFGEENSPMEQVALTVPVTDDPTLPVVTFRIWVLGILACVLLSFLNQFFRFRREPLFVSSISAQIVVVPLGHLMASVVTKRVFFKGRKWEFSLNPGPFSIKEHVLITIFASSGAANPLSIYIVSVVKVFYKRTLTFWVALVVTLTTQVLGFGWAGIFRRYLVEPAEMWWPQNLVQVSLFRDLWLLSKSAFQEKKIDVHTKLMRRYNQVPEWWFTGILILNIAATIFICEYYNEQLQLPWWGVLLACFIAFFFTLPVGVITATTNQTPGLNVITEYIIGYLYPGYPVANMCFKVYGSASMSQGLAFLQDFKLGHYMKIPPRAMFMAQVVGTVISAFVHLGTAWWLLEAVPNICERAMLPPGSPWTCPTDHLVYDASVIWGLIGPKRIFGDLGYYSAINCGFLLAAIVWLMQKALPNQPWIRLISVPVILSVTSNMPPATAVNYNSWIVIAFSSGFVAFRYYRDWWSRHNYLLSGSKSCRQPLLHPRGVADACPSIFFFFFLWILTFKQASAAAACKIYSLSGALDAGLAFMGILICLALNISDIPLAWWGSKVDGCPLASCPAAQGVVVMGCPVS